MEKETQYQNKKMQFFLNSGKKLEVSREDGVIYKENMYPLNNIDKILI